MKTKAEIVRDWLPRYTGRPLEEFGEYILLSNFVGYVEMFARRFGVELGVFPRLLAAEAACAGLPPFAAAVPERQPDAE